MALEEIVPRRRRAEHVGILHRRSTAAIKPGWVILSNHMEIVGRPCSDFIGHLWKRIDFRAR